MKRVAKFEKVSYEQFENDMRKLKYYFDDTIIYMYESIILPKRATKFSAGHDFCSPFDFSLNPGQTIKIPTGIRCGMNIMVS